MKRMPRSDPARPNGTRKASVTSAAAAIPRTANEPDRVRRRHPEHADREHRLQDAGENGQRQGEDELRGPAARARVPAFGRSQKGLRPLFFISLYLQTGLGYSPLGTGAAFLPMTGLILVVAPLAGRLTDRFGGRWPATAGMLLLALGLLLLAEIGLGRGVSGLLFPLAVIGLGVGLVTTPVTDAALAGAAEYESGVAAGVLNTSRMVGLSLASN